MPVVGASLGSSSPNYHYTFKPPYKNGRVRLIAKKIAEHCPFSREKRKLLSKRNKKWKALSAKRNGCDKRRHMFA